MSAEMRRRAYLDALGIDVWTRRAAVKSSAAQTATVTQIAPPPGLPTWDQLRQRVAVCTRCALHKSRTQTVFGVGSVNARLMIIGEAPGAEEDRRGEPFVGRAGKLLDEMLRAVGLDREQVYIANVLKCRPPNNRDPSADEAKQCRDHLDQQISLLNPRIILAVGRIAAHHLLKTDAPLGQLRGRTHSLENASVPVVVTYHPAYLLRSPTQKRKAWQDLCLARRLLAEHPT